MRDSDHNRLENLINRYLDGIIPEQEFEDSIRQLDPGIDIEALRSFATRVERIEELYRQLEEPDVPDGYWESFADRVESRLPDSPTRSAWDRLLDLILPTRWPIPALKYAGAVVSVLVVFFIGREIIESGKTDYKCQNYN